jgi:hypothetical protein
MSRERDGWEWVNGEPRWAPTVEVQIANITSCLYGDEYEEHRAELEDLVRAAQRDPADKIRARVDGDPEGDDWGLLEAADLIFPDYPEEENDSE